MALIPTAAHARGYVRSTRPRQVDAARRRSSMSLVVPWRWMGIPRSGIASGKHPVIDLRALPPSVGQVYIHIPQYGPTRQAGRIYGRR